VWGWGVGVGGLAPTPQPPIPNPQSPIPKEIQKPLIIKNINKFMKKCEYIQMKNILNKNSIS